MARSQIDTPHVIESQSREFWLMPFLRLLMRMQVEECNEPLNRDAANEPDPQ